METKIFRRIEEIPGHEWDRLFPGVLENHAFLKSLDESNPEQFSFYYITVWEDGRLAGAAPCFLMRYPLDTTVQGPLKSLVLAVKKYIPPLFELKALICGIPMGQGRIGFEGGAAAMIEAVTAAVEQIAAEEKVPVVAFKDFAEAACLDLDALQSRGYYRFESMPSTEMPVAFHTFDEYLKSLGKTSRDGLKRKLKSAAKAGGIHLEIKDRLDADELEIVYRLYLETLERHEELTFETLPKIFFERAAENMRGEAKFFLWRIGGRIAAFAFCLVSGTDFIDYYLGFDYAVALDHSLYYVRFRDLLEWCIENGIKRYEMGVTAYEVKRRMGFRFMRLFVYAKCRNRWLNPLFHLLCRSLKPENFDPVFKIVRERESKSRTDA